MEKELFISGQAPTLVAIAYNEEVAKLFPPHPLAVSPWEEGEGRYVATVACPEARKMNAEVNKAWGGLKKAAASSRKPKNS